MNSRRDHHDWKALARDLGMSINLLLLFFCVFMLTAYCLSLTRNLNCRCFSLGSTGYTSTRIASFEQRALEKQTGPTRHLFGDWAKREDSTVENLVSSLCNIGRHDVTLLLLPPINQENHQQTTSSQSRPSNSLPRTTTRCYKPISVV